MIQSLQGRGVPRQFRCSQWSGNGCRLERANCLPCSYVHRQLIPGLRTHHSKCTGAKGAGYLQYPQIFVTYLIPMRKR